MRVENRSATALVGLVSLTCLFGVSSERVCAQPFAYVTNQGSDDVSAIDTASGTVVATIVVGDRPSGAALTPDGARVYVTNLFANTVSVIDTATNLVTGTLFDVGGTTGGGPSGIAITPDGARAYVTSPSSGVIAEIDTVTNTVTSRIPVVGTTGIAIGNRGLAYVGINNFSTPDELLVLDLDSHSEVVRIMVGDAPARIAVTPDDTRVYVTNTNSQNVSVIDTSMNTVIATVSLSGLGSGGPSGVAAAPDSSKVYVADANRRLFVIDTTTNAVVATVTASASISDLAVTQDGLTVYATASLEGTVLSFDTASATEFGPPVTVGVSPAAIVLTSEIAAPVPRLTCLGFDPPMEGAVTVRRNRVLPHKARLVHEAVVITDQDLTAPPVIQVLFDSGVGPAVDVTDDALPAGHGSDGNQFVFTDEKWQFNLKTQNYTAAGTYTVRMLSGNDLEYVVDSCAASFVVY